MSPTVQAPVDLVSEVCDLFDDLFTDIERIRAALAERFGAGPVDAAAAREVVEPHARALLARGLALGAGFVAGPDTLSDRRLYLAWWQGDEPQLLGEADSPSSGAPCGYTRREWYRTPVETGHRHVTGPYVDYVCTDEYVVTSTVPLVVEERHLGVVGADVLAETLEDRLLPVLRKHGMTLAGESGRVMVSADHRRAPGALLDLAEHRVSRCGTLPLLLVD